MTRSEFSLIDRYFRNRGAVRPDVSLGVGDDAALLDVPAGQQLVVSTDTLLAGIHFPADTRPEDIGHKALAVNLSDLAAMGAEPAWVTLALTLPEPGDAWLQSFADGFAALAERCQVALVGGDTTRGPLSVTVQVMGLVPAGQALRRGGARPGERVYVTGNLGDGALALRCLQQNAVVARELRVRLDRPEPRLAAGLALRGLASSCIDLSDGLLADAGHVAEASGVGVVLDCESLPRSPAFQDVVAAGRTPDWLDLCLAGGDDYELCFTVAPERAAEAEGLLRAEGLTPTGIGEVVSGEGVRCRLSDGRDYRPGRAGFDHFAEGT